MDGTPYPPPAPTVPQPGAPQPQYPAAQPPAQPPKKKTGLIIGIVVGVLLLCCIITAVAGFLLFGIVKDSSDETLGEVITELESSSDNESTYEGSEWADFRPEIEDSSIYSRPSQAQLDLIDEVNSSLYPDFEVDDVVLEEGSEDAESFYPSILYVKASLSSDPAVRIAYYIWADWDEAVAAGYALSEDRAESYETFAVASDGTGYIYDNENLEGLIFGVSDQDVVDVLARADVDFPDYVVMMTTPMGDTCEIVITRWEAFPDLTAGLTVTYDRDGDSWNVTRVQEQ
jgi:hypothetical protein